MRPTVLYIKWPKREKYSFTWSIALGVQSEKGIVHRTVKQLKDELRQKNEELELEYFGHIMQDNEKLLEVGLLPNWVAEIHVNYSKRSEQSRIKEN